MASLESILLNVEEESEIHAPARGLIGHQQMKIGVLPVADMIHVGHLPADVILVTSSAVGEQVECLGREGDQQKINDYDEASHFLPPFGIDLERWTVAIVSKSECEHDSGRRAVGLAPHSFMHHRADDRA